MKFMEDKDKKKLIEVVLNKGDIDKVFLNEDKHKEEFLKKFNLKEEYIDFKKLSIEIEYSTDNNEKKIIHDSLSKTQETIVEKTKNVLLENGIEIPKTSSLSDKIEEIKKALLHLNIDEKEINNIINDGSSLTNKEDIIITFRDDKAIRDKLNNNGIVYEKTKNGLEVNSKIILQEGFLLENNEKNKKKLNKEDITYWEKNDKQRTLFVPLQAKKISTLLAASAIVGVVPAVFLQIVLNQSGLLDKLVDRHLLSLSQKRALNRGETILATQRVNGKDVEQYIAKDKQTGEIKRVNISDIKIPYKIKGEELSHIQLDELKKGNYIQIGDRTFKLDLNVAGGIKVMYKEMKTDRDFKTIPKPEDEEHLKLKYIALKGSQGIDDIYGKGGVNKERDGFLEKFDLKNDYMTYKIYEKDSRLTNLYNNSPNLEISKIMKEHNNQIKEKSYSMSIDNQQQSFRR